MNKPVIENLIVNKLRILNSASDDMSGRSIDDANCRSDILEKLESFDETKAIADQGLPAVGDTSELTCKYMIGPDEWVDFTWQVLGYNGSIPEYVKYKNENNGDIRYVRSVDESTGILKTDYSNSKTYIRSSQTFTEQTEIATVNGNDIFTYGQTNEVWGTTATSDGSYPVPRNLTIGGATYTFCGYNMTVASNYVLGMKKNDGSGDFAVNMTFDYNSKNSWVDSPLRAWMNNGDSSRFSNCKFYRYNEYNSIGTANDFTVLPKRFDSDMLDLIMPTVNRTWNGWETSSYDKTSTHFDHIVDKFWLLGAGQVNCDGSTAKNYLKSNYDTCKFSTVFSGGVDMWDSSDPTRVRYCMASSGEQDKGAPAYWWLRSAHRDYSYIVGTVSSHGHVNCNIARSHWVGCLPACSIG